MNQEKNPSSHAILNRSINSNSKINVLERFSGSYTASNNQMDSIVNKLKSKFPKSSDERIRSLLEELLTQPLVQQVLERQNVSNNIIPNHQVIQNYYPSPDIPLDQENIFLKEAIFALYRDYLKQIKRAKDLQKKLKIANNNLQKLQNLRQKLKGQILDN